MPIDSLSLVRLLSDRYQSEGVEAGAVGVVLDVYNDAYEVEFSREDGTTIAWFAVRQDEVEPYVDAEVPPLLQRGD